MSDPIDQLPRDGMTVHAQREPAAIRVTLRWHRRSRVEVYGLLPDDDQSADVVSLLAGDELSPRRLRPRNKTPSLAPAS